MSTLPKLAIFGIGNMGEAILGGLLDRGTVTPQSVIGVEALSERAREITERFGIVVTDDPAKAADQAEIILLAVKPKDVEAVLKLSGDLTGKLLVSICAGVTLDTLCQNAPGASVVRVMPNTPALVGKGASVYCPHPDVRAEDCINVEEIFGAVGLIKRLDNEGLMDAVTGLSGSGPAYVFLFLEALADGAVACGMPRELARELAAQTVLGAAEMARGSLEHTAELKDRVCSPGGTTIEAISQLEAAGFRSAVMEAVMASASKSKEMGD
jgi:pyrroline-5-carboxylate reductase